MEFTDWADLTHEERAAAIRRIPGPSYEGIEYASKLVKNTADLLQDNPPALAWCYHMPLGYFILNTPEQMAEYCAVLAEKGENIEST